MHERMPNYSITDSCTTLSWKATSQRPSRITSFRNLTKQATSSSRKNTSCIPTRPYGNSLAISSQITDKRRTRRTRCWLPTWRHWKKNMTVQEHHLNNCCFDRMPVKNLPLTHLLHLQTASGYDTTKVIGKSGVLSKALSKWRDNPRGYKIKNNFMIDFNDYHKEYWLKNVETIPITYNAQQTLNMQTNAERGELRGIIHQQNTIINQISERVDSAWDDASIISTRSSILSSVGTPPTTSLQQENQALQMALAVSEAWNNNNNNPAGRGGERGGGQGSSGQGSSGRCPPGILGALWDKDKQLTRFDDRRIFKRFGNQTTPRIPLVALAPISRKMISHSVQVRWLLMYISSGSNASTGKQQYFSSTFLENATNTYVSVGDIDGGRNCSFRSAH